MAESPIDRCPVCLAPLRSTPQGFCAYCGAVLPILRLGVVPSVSDTSPDASGLDDLAAAAKAGVPPSSEDARLLHLHIPKPHPLVDPSTFQPLSVEPNADEVALESHDSHSHLRDFLPSRRGTFSSSAVPPPLSLLPPEALSAYASETSTPLEDTPEAEAFIASFDKPLPTHAASPPTYPASFLIDPQLCSNCGASIPEGKKVCPNCGAST